MKILKYLKIILLGFGFDINNISWQFKFKNSSLRCPHSRRNVMITENKNNTNISLV